MTYYDTSILTYKLYCNSLCFSDWCGSLMMAVNCRNI